MGLYVSAWRSRDSYAPCPLWQRIYQSSFWYSHRRDLSCKKEVPKTQLHKHLVADSFILQKSVSTPSSVLSNEMIWNLPGFRTCVTAKPSRKMNSERSASWIPTASLTLQKMVSPGVYCVIIIYDHSRLPVSGSLFYNDNAYNFKKVLRDAIATYGLKERWLYSLDPSRITSLAQFFLKRKGPFSRSSTTLRSEPFLVIPVEILAWLTTSWQMLWLLVPSNSARSSMKRSFSCSWPYFKRVLHAPDIKLREPAVSMLLRCRFPTDGAVREWKASII